MSSSENSGETRSQKELANFVKNVHKRLRTKYKARNEDLDTIWKDHCENKSLLKGYAEAMHHLAVDHWTKHPNTRIDWCVDTIKEYFTLGGLHKILVKDEKRKFYESKRKAEKLEGKNDLPSDVQTSERAADGQVAESQFEPIFREEDKYREIQLPFEKKVRLLDVGSCFNPFGDQENILSIGIDISPATDKVYSCDFLALKTSEPLKMDTEHFETYMTKLTSPIDQLAQCSFHVVVFSLLLEYLPSPKQRWTCCTTAHELLMTNGLLLIITPDSHQQHRNAPMIKSWKNAIESIGFKRCRYIKQDHLHCMAFRKTCTGPNNEAACSEGNFEMLYIPQDSNNEGDMDNVSDAISHPKTKDETIENSLEIQNNKPDVT